MSTVANTGNCAAPIQTHALLYGTSTEPCMANIQTFHAWSFFDKKDTVTLRAVDCLG